MSLPPAATPTPVHGAIELDDDTLAAVVHLTGEGAAALVGAALGWLGAEVEHLAIDQVAHEPGRECTVTYTVVARWADGSATTETMVASTGASGPPPGAAVLESDGLRVGMWRYPFDPALPGLAEVVHPERAAGLVGHLTGTPVTATVLTYRPGRRAVVRLVGPGGTVYVKAVRPERSGRLAHLHRTLHAAGVRVPALAGLDEAGGVLLLDELAGRTLRDRVVRDGSAARVAPSAVVELGRTLDQLGFVDVGPARARRRPLRDVGAHVELLCRVTDPDTVGRVRRLHDRLVSADLVDDPERTGTAATVHGDLHDAQVVLDDHGELVGLLDLDDVGVGSRADDLANLIGHGLTMASAVRPGRRHLVDWVDGAWRLAAAGGLDLDEIGRRAAAATLSLATGSFRALDEDWPRITLERVLLAESLLDGHHRPAVTSGPVREVSEHRHGQLIAAREN